MTTVVPILGMHRSGASMIARALNLMGLDLGEPLIAPNPDYPAGSWENEFFIATNVDLLRTMQCNDDGFASPSDLLKLPELCQRIVVHGEKLEQIRSFIDVTFPGPVWGWKDPRTVLTWDVWQSLLTELGISDVRPVIVVRRPAASARSMVRRVQQNPDVEVASEQLHAMALDIWMAYNQILLSRCVDNDWLVVTYESFFDSRDAKKQLTRLADYCGLDRSLAATASDSIRMPCPPDAPPGEEDARALALYSQLTRHQTRAERSDTVIRPEPAEARLIVRADQFKAVGRIDAAVDLLTRGLELCPHYRAARFLLGYTLMETGHITASYEHSQKLIDSTPGDAVGYGLRAFGLIQQARIAEAMESYKECTSRLPSHNAGWSNMLFASLYADHLDDDAVAKMHREIGARIERNALSEANRPEPFIHHGRSDRIRVGYLSGDLKKHPVGYFMRSVLTHHDHDRFDVTCYDMNAKQDELTTILHEQADHWCNAREMTDDELCRRIRSDRIDVLVDLCGHSEGNRASMLAQRVAPVQAMYLGYPSTSGLESMDYLISDALVSPPELDVLYTERVQRLDQCFLCFHPYDDAPPVAKSPVESNGFVTFGSFNNLPKITPSTVHLWSTLLLQIPDSRLVMKSLSLVDPGTRELFYTQFESHGVDRRRIDLLPPTIPLSKFLEEYRLIDIGLDPIPFNGGTTTCESLWMGVPVITTPGDRFCSRMGLSILNSVGLNEFVAQSPDDYIRLACRHAATPDRLVALRKELRRRMTGSPLLDGAAFTQGLESAYKSMLKTRQATG